MLYISTLIGYISTLIGYYPLLNTINNFPLIITLYVFY